MAIANLTAPLLLCPLPYQPAATEGASNATIDAAGESYFAIGHIRLSSGPGTSKTLDNGGGKVHLSTSSVTFANAGTTMRIGVQDVSAAGVNDDTWTSEPQGDFVGGTDVINANDVNDFAIESGSRSIADGDLIAVGFEFISRGGTDQIIVPRLNLPYAMYTPHSALDSGAGPALVGLTGHIALEFTDGTIGWFSPMALPFIQESSSTFSSGSTPDEYAMVFRLPFPATCVGLWALVSNTAAADDFELILYSTPLGTPSATKTLSFDSSLYSVGSGGRQVSRPFDAAVSLAANTDYAVALRPTTANTLSFERIHFGGGGNLAKGLPLGLNWSQYSRTDQSGAFGSQASGTIPLFGLWLLGFDDGAAGGGGGGTGGFIR
jgi:hypothetical protein